MNYKLKENAGATGLVRGRVYTEKQINDLPGMGGVARLTSTGAIEATDEQPTPADADAQARSAENTTGNPPPLSKDADKQEQFQREHTQGPGDAAERAHPPTGKPGAVKAVGPKGKGE